MEPDAVRDVGRVAHGGETDPDVLDFSANTNPRTPPGTRAVYEEACDAARRYPDDGYPAFCTAAASFVGCDPADVVPTPGGLAAIRLAIATHVREGDSVLLPAPGFAEYAREVRLQGGRPAFVAADELPDADPARHAMVVICTPNNPTGHLPSRGRLLALATRCRDAGATLLVDEAFLGYAGQASLAGTEGTVVARSLTKLFGLPGLRAGYAVATEESRDRLRAARRAWNLSVPAARVGAHCLRQDAFVRETRRRVRGQRARLRRALATAYDVTPSAAPFLLLDVGDREAGAVVARAREAGVAIRDATTFRGLDAHVRIAVKDREANEQLLEAMDVRDAS